MTNFDYSIHYRKWHDGSKDNFEKHVSYYSYIFTKAELTNLTKEINILDVGCGFGLAIYAFNKIGYKKAKGIDISPEQLKVAQDNGLDVSLVEDSIKWLLKHEGQFDVITCFDVIEHIPVEQQLQFSRAINIALKNGGKFVCTVPNANSTFATRWRYIDWTHYSSFSEHSIEFLLLNSYFSSVNVVNLDIPIKLEFPYFFSKAFIRFILFKFIRGFRRLEALAELGMEGKNIPLSLNLLVVAEK